MANLVIVESPSKASTIKGYLGSNYKVIASKGHVRDLPKSTLGVDIDNNFDAHYINIRGKGDLIREIRKEAKAANKVFLATDPDREGEAISWHLAEALGIPVEKTMRVTFNEITKTAVKSAIKAPRQIDMNLVNSQQARRILDRIVGYKLSPFLWKNVRSGLSAGRVQSVATRIIVEREEEIRSFIPEEYWTVDALLQSKEGRDFSVRFYGDLKGRVRLSCEEEAMKVVRAVSGTEFLVQSLKKSKKKKLPAPPFTTSTMQQEASRKLGFQSQRIMRIAQELYEGVNVGAENGGVQGLITYMRTDSLRISADAQAAITELGGVEALPNMTLFGVDLGMTPKDGLFGGGAWLLILVPVLNLGFMYLSQYLSKKFAYQSPMQEQANGMSSMRIMLLVLPLMTMFITFSFASAIGIYWIFRTILSIGQQTLFHYVMPYPEFTEEDYKNAQKALKGKKGNPKAYKNVNYEELGVRSLHHIDD